jgi:energy-coupling factor transporter ATP-binding protein EcfA2
MVPEGEAGRIAAVAPLLHAPGGAETPSPETLPLIDLERVAYTYDGDSEPILSDVTLHVRQGEFVLILGPSGCGKSTLLQILNGVIPHSLRGKLSGTARSCGHDVATTRVAAFAAEVGMVFQDPEAQIINARVRDEVCFCLENLRWPAPEILLRQAEALALVGLADAGDRSVWDLSGGQKQRVSVAAVLAARPRLLVLDEPTANLDPVGMREVFAVLDRLRTQFGTAVVLVEHRVDELADRVSRVVMMEAGRIVFDGPPRAAFARRRATPAGAAGEQQSSGAWFPQLTEFALELADATSRPVDPAWLPLNQTEALACAEQVLAASPIRALSPPAASPPMAATPAAPLLTVSDLRFAYDGRAAILDGVSFALEPATIVALLGRNGSGKTTLARTLMGINPPPKGVVTLLGRDLAALGPADVAAEIGYVFQNPDHQFVTDRVDEEVAYGLRVRGWSDAAIAERVADVLSVVDLDCYRSRSPFSLSLGERRRLSVATVLALEPKLLILDEPTIGQDHERAQQLMGLMERLRTRYRSTVLMITHDVRLVADWASRAIVLGGGRVRFDGAPADLFAETLLLEEVGLMPPPLYALSSELARRHPGRVPHATLAMSELVAWLAGG